MFIAPLCSSSAANSTFIGNKSSGILIDAGCSYKALLQYLSIQEIDISAVKAVLVTHEHGDHVKGIKQLTKHNDIPVYASHATGEYLLKKEMIHNEENLFGLDQLANVPIDYDITAFPTPHDTEGSVGFTITSPNGYKVAYVTDLGEITAEVYNSTKGADFVFAEANYDRNMLTRNVRYPYHTKKRIASNRGHLSNNDSAAYISQMVQSGATRIMLAHLSRDNNSPQIAYVSVSDKLTSAGMRLNRDYTLDIAGINTNGEYIAV